MTEENRSDAMKATNSSLTPPGQDMDQPQRDYPELPHGREQVRTGSPEHISPSGYGEAAPAQPRAVANDLDEGANPGAGQTGSRAAEDIAPQTARDIPGVGNLAPGAASMEHANPNEAPVGRHTEPVKDGDPDSAPHVKTQPDADVPPPFSADAKQVRGAAVDLPGGETVPHGRTRPGQENDRT